MCRIKLINICIFLIRALLYPFFLTDIVYSFEIAACISLNHTELHLYIV